MDGVSRAYHLPLGMRLQGRLDPHALRSALDRIVARHEVLRTTFVFHDEQPVQQIAQAEESRFLLLEHDLRLEPDAESELSRLAQEEADTAFHLEHGPLIRGRLVRLAEEEHALLITMHHIVSDGWSMGVLSFELSALYGAFLHGEEDPLPELKIQYVDYAVWQRQWIEGEVLQRQASYWKTALLGAPALLELPTDYPRPAQQDFAGGFAKLSLDEPLTAALKELSRRHGTTLFMTLMAGWAVLLARLSGQQTVVIGTPTANRGRAEIERLIGFFVNTLAIRIDLDASPSGSALLQQVKVQTIAAQQHQDIPFEQVVELMQPVRSLSHSPLFQAMFAWQNNASSALTLPGLEQRPLRSTSHTVAKFDLTLSLKETGDTIAGGIEYATSLFNADTIERYIGYFKTLLNNMASTPAMAVDRLPLLSPLERRRVLYEWNDTAADYPADVCIHELFEEHVKKSPDAVALVFEDRALSYGELNRRANRLAHHLRSLGVQPDDRVAICVERGFEMIVALLAVLKAGGAYVPLDPAYPVERLQFMIEDSAPVALLTQGHLGPLFTHLEGTLTVLDLDDASPWQEQPETNPDPDSIGLTSHHLAYVIYTSGSTGLPKGVMVQHRGLCNLVQAQIAAFFLSETSRMLQFSSFSFDASVSEVMTSICSAAQLHLSSKVDLQATDALSATVASHAITHATLPPAILALQPENMSFGSIHVLVVAGDKANAQLNRPSSKGLLLINAYGPTETTVCATLYSLSSQTVGTPPIGRPIANTRIYILDVHGEPVPVGVAGELYIAGAGVARGYLNRPELTAERFLPDPFVSEQGARMYRTGDLGRWMTDGNIEFLGRNDFQVKIRGFRIELGEIETKLMEHPDVREAVVIAREDTPGDKRLVAYYTADPSMETGEETGEETSDAGRLRSYLSALLPEYMVPAAYVQLSALPLTPNGKLDRKALPAPGSDAYATRGYEAPQGELETRLANVWEEVLKVERVGRHDNFFELGGHSLLAVRLVTYLRQSLNVEVSVRDLFEKPILYDFRTILETAPQSILPPIVPAERETAPPLSFAQQRLWFLAQMDGVSRAYHLPLGMRLQGRLDPHALRSALDRIVARHEVLRTTFVFHDEQPVQQIAQAEESRFLLLEHDLRLEPDAESELSRLAQEEADTAFHLEHGPLIRGRLVRLAEEEHALLITMHHIVSDGWSMGVLSFELSALYGAFLHGEEDPLPELKIQYVDYAVWQRQWIEGEVLQRQASYWKTALLGAPALLELPTDYPRPAQQDFAGGFAKLSLDEPLTAALKELSRRHGTTLFMTLMAGWAVLLARLSGQQTVVIGTPTANRGRAEIERLIGFFVNTLAIRIDLDASPSGSALLQQVKVQTIAAQQHQDIPFEQVVELMQPVRSLSHSPLFQAMFAWQNNASSALTLPGLEQRPLRSTSHTVAKFDLTLSLKETGDTIAGGIEYATSLFNADTIERYIGYFKTLLNNMASTPAMAVDRLPLLSPLERRRVLYEWNDTAADYPADVCIHELFEEQVKKSPDAVALVFEDRSLSYGELNRRANRLAHHLRSLGVQPDDRVAICVERGFEMIVALLAVLKAGGAYVPLDPAYPVERLQFMIEDSAPVALLTQGHLGPLFTHLEGTLTVLDLDDASPWQEQPETNPDPDSIGLTSHHLAYVIYTSGSTGLPKGVMVQHQNVTSLTWHADYAELNPKFSVAQIAPLAFDASTFEIWGSLLNGARLCVVQKLELLSSETLATTLSNNGVHTAFLTTALFHQFSNNNLGIFQTLRQVLFGGELHDINAVWRVVKTEHSCNLIHVYGPTETTTFASFLKVDSSTQKALLGIGHPIKNKRIYILDVHGEPVPVGVAGELYIAGAGVARGYLNRPELTAERFLPDPFVSEQGARMYRTGDLGRWMTDGNIEFLGRNDFQVKIRGFRIELGEIETKLMEHPDVREAVVIAREDTPGDKRLVAYYTADPSMETGEETGEETSDAGRLRSYLSALLPEYMVPAAYVQLSALPLTPNGKLDRKALPAPGSDAYATRGYEAPQGGLETRLANVWEEVLKVERVGRHDNFFELGGHSLLAVTMIQRMRRNGIALDVRALFATPTLADLAASIDIHAAEVPVPRNLILPGCMMISPSMVPLMEMTQEEIDLVVHSVPGGTPNVQDIYPLAPLQEGILFHHLLEGQGDPYLLATQMSFDSRERLDRYLHALQAVISRHDILRTAIQWEGLREPAQVVWREATLPVEEVTIDPAQDVAKELYDRFDPRHVRIDLKQAPLLRLYVAHDPRNSRWLTMTHMHHLVGDHTTLEVMQEEIQAHLLGTQNTLPNPLPFRNLIAQARLGVSRQEHEDFFKAMLGDVEEPTAPFGLLDVQGDGSDIEEVRMAVEQGLAQRLRAQARRLGVNTASLCHLAWAQVLAKISGRTDVVFGTVLFGRMQGGEGADRALGLFINTLPIRITVDQETSEACARRMHLLLAQLMHHEHASLALAQRCSAVPAPAPLFSSLLNYRHSPGAATAPSEEMLQARRGIRGLRGEERTNYPITLSVTDFGEGFSLDAQTPASIGAARLCEFMHTALASLTIALEASPETPVRTLEVLPPSERRRVLYEWNDTAADYPADVCIHELFEEQVKKSPDAVALVFEDRSLSYEELNRRANRLAHHLRSLGVQPDDRVAICVERGFEMIVALLAVLKAGGAYVPLDPAYPVERLQFMIEDSAPVALLTQGHLGPLFTHLEGTLTVLDLDDASPWQEQPETNPDPDSIGLTSHHLAYVIYTSGSTGLPKGVMVQHRGLCNLVHWHLTAFSLGKSDTTSSLARLGFDAASWELWPTVSIGATVLLLPPGIKDPVTLLEWWKSQPLTSSFLPTPLAEYAFTHEIRNPYLKSLAIGGDRLHILPLPRQSIVYVNSYGLTEATVVSTSSFLSTSNRPISIGRPIANTRIYILDVHGEPVPVGVAGELYIAGAGVARGYLNRPELTAERFLPDPFVSEQGARMYRTGDLGRWMTDGNIEFLGRNDFQVKIRGFRIELGEIETKLMEHPDVREAVVIAREDTPGDKRLVAYYTADPSMETGEETGEETSDAGRLRSYLSALLPEYMVPAAYVQLSALPLTPNGKLDRKALPIPKMPRDHFDRISTPRELRVRTIVKEVLDIKHIDPDDDFFGLGGHSLTAIKLVNRLSEEFGKPFALSTLLIGPTVSKISANLHDVDISDPFGGVLTLREGNLACSPLFFFPPGAGLTWCYFGLLKYVSPQRPVYGIQSPRFTSSEDISMPLEEMARVFSLQIQRLQPKGPYTLAGWSSGGLLAFAVAQTLRELGHDIASLCLFDTYPEVLTIEELQYSMTSHTTNDMLQIAQQIFPGYQQNPPRSLAEFSEALRKDQRLPDIFEEHRLRALLLSTQDAAQFQLKSGAKTYAGDVIIFIAASGSEHKRLYAHEAWQPYVQGNVRTHEIFCRHSEMMKEDSLAQLGPLFSVAISSQP